MRNILSLAVLLVAAPAFAGVTNVQAVLAEGAGIPAGFVSNDILIDFEGNLRGQQMIVALSQGTMYQDAFGSNTAPTAALIPAFPAVAFDSFVTVGGATASSSQATLVVGGAPNLPGDSTDLLFDTTGANIAWAPGTGVNVPNGTGYLTARLTLSDDAVGEVWYFGSTSGTDDPLVAAPGGNFPVGLIQGGA
ncbi:MAG: hypothetical protein RLO48_13370, partial [Bauldia litoralis]